RTILFREEHSPRVLVPKVDIVSAPGTSPSGVFRRGTAQALVTGKCLFSFNPAAARFTLTSIHPGETAASLRQATGFDYDSPEHPPVTPDPTPQELELLRGPVCDEMLETYPEFCRRVWNRTGQAGRAA
ncbi:MAG TPA: CoA synthetase, partial [Acetobacteraceae bacterium]